MRRSKLTLRRETVRVLRTELRNVRGGVITDSDPTGGGTSGGGGTTTSSATTQASVVYWCPTNASQLQSCDGACGPDTTSTSSFRGGGQ